MAQEYQIYACGGVIIKKDDNSPETFLVGVVHRPKYDDWTLPKGKIEIGEQPVECALREVLEETGHVCRAGEELSSSSYLDAQGKTKLVRYWLMEVTGGSFVPNEEVDSMLWLPLEEAKNKLTYDRDLIVLTSAEPHLFG